MLLLLLLGSIVFGDPRGPIRSSAIDEINPFNPNMQNRVQHTFTMRMNFTNYGFFGNESASDPNALTDPIYGGWAPPLEFPVGSNTEYLYIGGIWVGALVQQNGSEFPRVSVGIDGWVNPAGRLRGEFCPGEGTDANFQTNVTNAPNSMACCYTDTSIAAPYVPTDVIDGTHFPLGIKVTQLSCDWHSDFIVITYNIENISTNYLKNVYLGFYFDGDVGRTDEVNYHTDDITGFIDYYYNGPNDSSLINTAWIADNDGRPHDVNSGHDFTCAGAVGVKLFQDPNPHCRTSYNWWISNGNSDLDYGPSWQDGVVNGELPNRWPDVIGTPMGDTRKYLIMSNGEHDFDQYRVNDTAWIAAHPQPDPADTTRSHNWRRPDANNADIANGYDARFLISFGPLGIFNNYDPQGRAVYRLYPGESTAISLVVFGAWGFHDENNPQVGNTLDPTKYQFNSIGAFANVIRPGLDLPMVDTHTLQFPNGDGWYGEDTGSDGLYGVSPGDSVIIDGIYYGMYPGPDADGSENNGIIDTLWNPNLLGHTEDTHPWRPERYRYQAGNGILDAGDGEPDLIVPTMSVRDHATNKLPTRITMLANYPNPFNSETIIRFELPARMPAKLAVFDLMGRQVAQIVNNETMNPGMHSIQFNGKGIASGTYFVELTAGNQTSTRKILLLK